LGTGNGHAMSLLVDGGLAAKTDAKSRRHGAGDLAGRVDHLHAGRFQRGAFAGVTAGATGDDGAGMTHLLARRRRSAGNERDHRLAHGPGVAGRLLFHSSTDFADNDYRVGAGVLVERLERIARGGAEHRIAPDAEEGGLAEAGARQIEADERTQAARARDDADTARLEHRRHEGRHDADKTFAWRDETGRI